MKTITINKKQLHDAITKYGLGGSNVVLDNLWRILGGEHDDTFNLNSTSVSSTLDSRLPTPDEENGEQQK